MKKVGKKEIVSLLLVHLFILVLESLFLSFYNAKIYREFTIDVNHWVGGVIEEIKEKYPNINEEELINLLNSDGKNSELLEKMGIGENNIAILSLEKRKSRTFLIGFITILLSEVLVIFYSLYCYAKKNQSINHIINHVKELNKKINHYDKTAKNPFLEYNYAHNPFKSAIRETRVWVEKPDSDCK